MCRLHYLVQCTTLTHMSDPRLALLSTVEVCALLGVDRSTLTRWVASERVRPAHKMAGRNGAFLFRADDIERLRIELAGEAQASDSPQPAQARAS